MLSKSRAITVVSITRSDAYNIGVEKIHKLVEGGSWVLVVPKSTPLKDVARVTGQPPSQCVVFIATTAAKISDQLFTDVEDCDVNPFELLENISDGRYIALFVPQGDMPQLSPAISRKLLSASGLSHH